MSVREELTDHYYTNFMPFCALVLGVMPPEPMDIGQFLYSVNTSSQLNSYQLEVNIATEGWDKV